MGIRGLAEQVATDKEFAAVVEDARDGRVSSLDLTAPPALRPFLVEAIASAGRTVLAVTATAREAEDLVASLDGLLPAETVAYYPAWETLPHERLSPRSDTVGRRLAVLRRLAHPGSDATTGPVQVVVAPVRSVLQPQVRGLADLEPVDLSVGDSAELEAVVERLAAAAYHRVDLVEKRGEFAVRGGIVDVFPPTEEHPLRAEFFGDEVEEIRSFSVADQRSLEPVGRLWAPPCRELLLTDEVRARAADLAEGHPELADILGRMAEGHAVEGMESLAPVLVDEMELLVDLLPDRRRCSSSIPSGSAAGRTTWLPPARSSSRRRGRPPRAEATRRSTWVPPRTGSSATYGSGASSVGVPWWSISPFGLDPDPPRRRGPARSASPVSTAITVTSSAWWPTCAPGWGRADGSRCSTRGTARRSGSPRS